MMFEFWIELAHVVVCYIGVYCAISVGIWLMVQAIDEIQRIRRKPNKKPHCSIEWDYEKKYNELQSSYDALNVKYKIVCTSQETLLEHFEELKNTCKCIESENKKLKFERDAYKQLYDNTTRDLDD